jgi:hypothetical protein
MAWTLQPKPIYEKGFGYAHFGEDVFGDQPWNKQAKPGATTFGLQAKPGATTFGKQAKPGATTFSGQAKPGATTWTKQTKP